MLARRNFFNDFMSDPFDFGFFGTEPAPKENVQIELNDGYLTINASTNEEKEDKDENGTFLRKERFVGSCRRSFYVGDDVSEDDISAKFENGILSINVPKKELPKPEDRKRLISID